MSTATIEERLLKISSINLKAGSHAADSKMCVMEAVAFVRGLRMG